MKKSLWISLIIILLIIAIPFSPKAINPVLKIFENKHNAKIDYSCNVDSDCTIKEVGCDKCNGKRKGCVNKDSIEGWCSRVNFGFSCASSSLPPTSCSCENNVCTTSK